MTTLQNDKFIEYGIKVGIPLVVVSLFCTSVGIGIDTWKAIGMVSLCAAVMQLLLMVILQPSKSRLGGMYRHLWAGTSVLVSLGSAVAVYYLTR